MKRLSLIAFIILCYVAAKAQDNDRVYVACPLKTATKTKADDGTDLFDSCPSFKGGAHAMNKYFTMHSSGKKGKIIIIFYLEKDGSPRYCNVQQGVSPAIDKKAVKFLEGSTPKWKPAILKGKPVRMLYAVTIKVVS